MVNFTSKTYQMKRRDPNGIKLRLIMREVGIFFSILTSLFIFLSQIKFHTLIKNVRQIDKSNTLVKN